MRQASDALEPAMQAVSEQAAAADALVYEALEAGLGGSHPLTLHAKMLRLELLNVKAGLERELSQLRLDCSSCGRTVHWVVGLGVTPGHWAPKDADTRHWPMGASLKYICGKCLASLDRTEHGAWRHGGGAELRTGSCPYVPAFSQQSCTPR